RVSSAGGKRNRQGFGCGLLDRNAGVPSASRQHARRWSNRKGKSVTQLDVYRRAVVGGLLKEPFKLRAKIFELCKLRGRGRSALIYDQHERHAEMPLRYRIIRCPPAHCLFDLLNPNVPPPAVERHSHLRKRQRERRRVPSHQE